MDIFASLVKYLSNKTTKKNWGAFWEFFMKFGIVFQVRKLAIKFIILNRKDKEGIFLFFYFLVFYLFSLKNNLKSNCYVFVTACSPRSSLTPVAPGLKANNIIIIYEGYQFGHRPYITSIDKVWESFYNMIWLDTEINSFSNNNFVHFRRFFHESVICIIGCQKFKSSVTIKSFCN